MRANNPREKQKVTSGCQESCQQLFSSGVHPKFLVEISHILVFQLKIVHFFTIFLKKFCFFQKPSGASMSVLSECWSTERKIWLQRKDSCKIIWFIFGMHPKGTQITKFKEKHNLGFSKYSKSRWNLMNARGKPDKSLKKCAYFHPS